MEEPAFWINGRADEKIIDHPRSAKYGGRSTIAPVNDCMKRCPTLPQSALMQETAHKKTLQTSSIDSQDFEPLSVEEVVIKRTIFAKPSISAPFVRKIRLKTSAKRMMEAAQTAAHALEV